MYFCRVKSFEKALSAAEKQRRYRQRRDADPGPGHSTISRPKTENENDGSEKQFKDRLEHLQTAQTFCELQKLCSDLDLGGSLQGEHRSIHSERWAKGRLPWIETVTSRCNFSSG